MIQIMASTNCDSLVGNGRPFILEVSGSYVDASEDRMQEIIRSVAAQDPDSFNSEGDVELLMLKKVRHVYDY